MIAVQIYICLASSSSSSLYSSKDSVFEHEYTNFEAGIMIKQIQIQIHIERWKYKYDSSLSSPNQYLIADHICLAFLLLIVTMGVPLKPFCMLYPFGKRVANVDMDKFKLRGRSVRHPVKCALLP